jgi:SAM-dependent methyltransferase
MKTEVPVKHELERIRNEYDARDREKRSWKADIYHPRHPLGHLQYQQRFDVLVDAFNTLDVDLGDKRILDYGCGTGGWLRMLVELGADPTKLVGMDMSPVRLDEARRDNPAMAWKSVAGDVVDEPNSSFDIVMQSSVFSSILDEELSRRLAGELARVLKPGGLLLFCDLLISSPGRLTAYPLERVRALFEGWDLVYRRQVFPQYVRRFHRYQRLCSILARLTDFDAESSFSVLRKPA